MKRILSRILILGMIVLMWGCPPEIRMEAYNLVGYVLDEEGNGIEGVSVDYFLLGDFPESSDLRAVSARDSSTTTEEGAYFFEKGSIEGYEYTTGGCDAGPLEFVFREQFALRIITGINDTLVAIIFPDSLWANPSLEIINQADTAFIGNEIISLESLPRMMPDIVIQLGGA